MFSKTFYIALTEARMSARGWRFWLLLLLIGGLSLLARNYFILHVEQGFYLHPAFAFQNPSFWLMLAVSILGTVSLSMDAVGRLQRTGVDKILFPLPVGTLQLFWGMFLGVLIIVLPLSALGVFSLAAWQSTYGHAPVIWQPFCVAYGYMVLPVLLPVSAMMITLRTFFKHDFAALLIGCALLAVVGYFRNDLEMLLDFAHLSNLLVNASPNLGVLIDHRAMLPLVLVHVISAFVLLIFAPLYLRRQQPQKVVISRVNSSRIFGIRTILRWLTGLRFDKHLGWGYRVTLTLTLLVFGAGGLMASYHYQESVLQRSIQKEHEKLVNGENIDPPAIDVTTLESTIAPENQYRQLKFETTLHFTVQAQTDVLNFELDPKYRLQKVHHSENPVLFDQKDRRVRVKFSNSLHTGTTEQLVFIYTGQPQHFHTRYSRLQGQWFPQPWNQIRGERGRRWIETEDDYFNAEITLHLKPNQSGAFAGQLVSSNQNEYERIEEWTTFYPVNRLQLHWGAYDVYDVEKPGYTLRFYHLPYHGYQAAVYLEEIREQEEYIREKLGALPFPQLTVIETPYLSQIQLDFETFFNFEPQETRSAGRVIHHNAMPGLAAVTENNISYLDERMWLMERFDHDPQTIPFYEQIPNVLETIHNQFYGNLIDVYFDHTLQPAGEYAFWLEDHFSGYASSLLEKNPWRRREQLRFDVGINPQLPLSVARSDSLLELRKKGQYPQLESTRGRGLFRMLHHLMGEETWWNFLQIIFRDYRFEELTAEKFLALAEDFYGKPLNWFREQWLEGTALPSYEIITAEARMIEKKLESEVEYETVVTVKNHGTGRMAVPIFLETEMDYVFRDLWLDEGEQNTLNLRLPHRPIFAIVDPQNWILQEPFYDKTRKRRMHSETRVNIIGERGKPTAPRKGDFGRRGRWR